MGDLAAQLRTARQKGAMTTRRAEQLEQDVGKLEQQNAELRTARLAVTSPLTYSATSPHSYFADLARVRIGHGDGDGGKPASLGRLNAHVREMGVEMPARREARARAAREGLERVLNGAAGDRLAAAQRQALERFDRAGGKLFETRAVTRVDTQGGFFSPPLWLLEEWGEAIRAGREFADTWSGLPLPPNTDSINIPRVNVGTATGPQVADIGPVPGRDATDNFVAGRVVTIAGQQDASLQLLDQSPAPGADAVIFRDLMADYNLNLNGQCLIGAGANGQLPGAILAGSASSSQLVVVTNANNASGQTWLANGGSGDAVSDSAAKLLSVIARTRKRPPTHWVLHTWTWYQACATKDSQNRTWVTPGAGPPDPLGTGIAGHLHSVPVILAPDMPVSFGGSSAPVIGAVSTNGSAAVEGNGTWSVLLAGYWPDALLFESEPRTDTLKEIISGQLGVRFRLFNYCAGVPNRFQAAAAAGSFVSAGGCVSFGVMTQYQANSPLQLSNAGF